VLNANNLKRENGEWIIDTSIDTTTLLTPNSSVNDLSSITLPESLTFPAQPTKNISISGNLNGGDIADKVETAKLDSDFGVLYDRNQKDMHIQEGENLAFGFGENINYENGLIKIEFCIADDPIDNKDVNIDFLVNGTEIKTTLKDGATKEEIKDAIAKELEKNSILYEKSESGIKLKNKEKLIVENRGDILKSSGAEVLSYKKNPQNEGEFQTIEQFINNLQSIADKIYPETTSISLNEKGQLSIQNNSDKTIVSTLLKTENSNQAFLENLGSLGKVINSNTATTSLTFNEASEGFTGNIIDSTGEKNSLKFTFRKVEKEEDKTIWNLDLKEIDKEGNVKLTSKREESKSRRAVTHSPDVHKVSSDLKASIDKCYRDSRKTAHSR
jgi:flagellar hook protein FlgE